MTKESGMNDDYGQSLFVHEDAVGKLGEVCKNLKDRGGITEEIQQKLTTQPSQAQFESAFNTAWQKHIKAAAETALEKEFFVDSSVPSIDKQALLRNINEILYSHFLAKNLRHRGIPDT